VLTIASHFRVKERTGGNYYWCKGCISDKGYNGRLQKLTRRQLDIRIEKTQVKLGVMRKVRRKRFGAKDVVGKGKAA